MAIVVTGSVGFLGRAVVRALLEAGHDVVGIDRRAAPSFRVDAPHRKAAPAAARTAAHMAALPASGRPRLTSITADLVDRDERVAAALTAADAVIHLAGCPGVRDDRIDVAARRRRDNVAATQAVLAAVPRRTPLVVASSSSVYGGSVRGRPCAEADPLRPRGGYARSKLIVERLCAQRLESGGLVAIARPFTVAGEGQRPDMALARWIAAARAGRPLRIMGSADRTRDVTDVRQAAAALLTLALDGARGWVNVGTGVGHRLRDLAGLVADLLDTDVTTEIVPAHPDDVADTLADTRTLRRLVGFVPQTDLRDVVRRQIAATQTEAALAAEPPADAPADLVPDPPADLTPDPPADLTPDPLRVLAGAPA